MVVLLCSFKQMKASLVITFCFIYLYSFAQTDSLPPANKLVLNYVNTQVGNHIKTGMCFDFVAEALDQVDPNWRERRRKLLHRGTRIYGKRIRIKKLQQGDIILFEWKNIESRTKRRTTHVCIAYSIDKSGNIKVAEQNGDGAAQSKTKVWINNFDPTGKANGTKVYKLRYYRPY